MSQNESQILNAFLVSSSNLHDIATLNTFVSLFPSTKRSHPDISTLYRLLQAQRNSICQIIKKNIQLECKLSTLMNMNESIVGIGETFNNENMHLHDEQWQLDSSKPLVLPEMLKQMEEAVDRMQKEMEKLGKNCDDLLQNMKVIISEMNNLRSDKPSIDHTEETVNGLKELIETCEELLKNSENVYHQTENP
ncbi:hypothetical protein PCANB_001733 [Pneumocystis canis]|nr:hypothetical protein PCK1_002040 [Pneumocystis canis]KAG5440164.1 hypothetical protein PCANB_001733 [Pneumocystis canis]